MNHEEAKAWLNGDRSTINIIPQEPLETWEVRIAQADSARVQQAYWVLRSYKEMEQARMFYK